ncbi:MAG: TonB-dependent receptor [Pyrinomonadaceae bacterium]|nr:TonB-dependent receptor [Pyrinomonadaceae bacterium]
MRSFPKAFRLAMSFALVFALCSPSALAQRASGILAGRVVDQQGGIVVGATVTIADASGVERTATTNDDGAYTFTNLAPGRYTVRVNQTGFGAYENAEVDVTTGQRVELNIDLSVALAEEQVTVESQAALNTDPANNGGATVLRGRDLETLPEDPDDLAAALQALAGPSAGPNGGQIYIDGFTGGRLPPRESIRQITINQNPFSAEFDRLGFGRIEITTKPGTDKLRGQTFFRFEDESLNSRNPFAPNRAPFQSRLYGGNLSGPVIKGRASFFLDFERRDIDDNAVIRATILDPALNITPFSLAVLTPQRRTTFSPRFDYQINNANTIVARYSYSSFDNPLAGIGSFSLLSRAFSTKNSQHLFQITETAVINPRVVNETRFQFVRGRREQEGDNSQPSIIVREAFSGGGSQVGLSFNNETRYELQNYTTLALGAHSVKAGGRLRSVRLTDSASNNFGGTLVFTSLEQYRNVLLGVPGALPSQFTIAGGNPEARVSQVDLGLFAQDDWRVRPDLTLSYGLRYETQTNIDSNLNFAPRVAFAYSPGAGGTSRPKTVFRGGFGVFYDRVGENFTLESERFNGVNQQQFIVSDQTIAGRGVLSQIGFTANGAISNLPSTADLILLPQTTRQIAEGLQTPYTMQAAFSVERQLPFKIVATASYITTRTLHLLRARNINAPLPGTFDPLDPTSVGARPSPGQGNIYQFESSGRLNQNQLVVNVRNQFGGPFTVFATYVLNKVNSDAEGGGFFGGFGNFGGGGGLGSVSFPANQYDLSEEYGRSNLDVRHRLFLGGNVNAPFGISLNPFIIASSSQPFNITTGIDNNRDTLFTDRPAFADAQTLPQDLRVTQFGNFDINPKPGQQIVPRNYGGGPGFFVANLRISKSFGFGDVPARGGAAAASPQGGGAQTGGAPAGGGRRNAGAGGGARGGRGAAGGGGSPLGQGGGGLLGGGAAGRTEKRYNLTLSVDVQNILNRTNRGGFIGSLTSPFFGQSIGTAGGFGGGGAAGNRRIGATLRFSF